MRRLLFPLLSLGLCALVLEGTFRLGSLISPGVAVALAKEGPPAISRWIPDDRLGARPNPEDPDHDSRGFRNARAIETADVVCLGDSQTYGSGVERSAAWPAALARESGHEVYSMAYPSYGPVQCDLLLDEALALKPNVVLVAFYSGNDLYDAYRHVYLHEGGAERRRPELVAPLGLFEVQNPFQPLASSTVERGFLSRLADRSHLVSFAREVRNQLEDPWDRAVRRAERAPARFDVVEAPRRRTILTPAYRSAVLNQEDPRMKEGLEQCIAALESIADRCAVAGVRCVVVGIPTKEFVCEGYADSPALRTMLERERAVWDRVERFLEERAIAFVPVREVLRQCDSAPYHESTDGHPSPAGHRAIARELSEFLR